MIDSAEDGSVLTLERDYTAIREDRTPEITAGRTLTLDLNGHTVDGRALAADNVLLVNGSLTLRDAAGGGSILGAGGAGTVRVGSGTLTLTGGTVAAEGSEACGIAIDSDGLLRVEDVPVLEGFIRMTAPALVAVTGPLGEDVRLRVAPIDGISPMAVTTGLSGNGTMFNFISEDEQWYVGRDADGEAFLSRNRATVTFAPGNGSATGSMETLTIARGSEFVLPECGYRAAGFRFREWSVRIGGRTPVSKAPGETVTITSTENTVMAVWKEAAEPAFNGHAVVLTGQIGLQFLLELPEGRTPEDYPGSYVTFEGNKVDSTAQAAMPANTFGSSGRYMFQINLTSVRMADRITPTFHWTEGGEELTVAGDPYSVEDYIDWALTALTGDNLAIVQSLADYGYYAQQYLSVQNGWTIGEDYAAQTTHVTASYDCDAIKAEAAGYAIVKGTNETITKVTYKLNFDDTLTLTVYLTPAAGVKLTSVLVDGTAQKPVKSGGRYSVKISGIKASELTDIHTIVAEGAVTTVSPMSYVYDMLNTDGTGAEGRNLVCALYNYAQACGN